MSLVPLESIGNINEGYSRCFKVAGKHLLLVHSGGETKLLPLHCPHQGYSLKKAQLSNGYICCPKHRISFSLCSGQAQGGELVSDVSPLRPIEYIVQDGMLNILSDE